MRCPARYGSGKFFGKGFLMTVAHFRKFIVALAAALSVLGAGLSDGEIDSSEAVAVGLAFLGAYGVYRVPNAPAEEV
jgi:hypothetical protein